MIKIKHFLRYKNDVILDFIDQIMVSRVYTIHDGSDYGFKGKYYT